MKIVITNNTILNNSFFILRYYTSEIRFVFFLIFIYKIIVNLFFNPLFSSHFIGTYFGFESLKIKKIIIKNNIINTQKYIFPLTFLKTIPNLKISILKTFSFLILF